MPPDARSTIRLWHDALNRGDVGALVTLVHPQVEIGGPRGSTRGVDVLAEWFDRARVRLWPRRWFGSDGQVVVEETGEWLSFQGGETLSSQRVATAFTVNDEGLITRIVRHDALEAALEDCCLTLEDQFEFE